MFFSPSSIHVALDQTCAPYVVLALGAQDLVLIDLFIFVVLYSLILLPVCALIRSVLAVVSAIDIPYLLTGCMYILYIRT